ncbi:pyruvate dehydrogenase (acetyl-transferring) E1 component subunit alpha [Marispirochaeta aestuarii]|uniref:Pyruvate dehydrogenase E1 component subunit alpha n=1 Tax=Marispirochaeta aestuarii TaxID=1963862 RepID=A0A1Y1RY28_9SPIO|nr:pyruvate dehydrogenase (acetyl-transferring) E1 component subunit alpha [Marispirochaeta aestuarii]ORC35330.1 pyruvate dehydrogenase (acetyl-transferring) E1 component subunit alpha [Marispirochaeta aestuarii]
MSLVKKYGKETTLSLLQSMLLMRRFEEKAGQMYGLRKIGGFCHLYIGQEAVAAGTIGALDLKSDYIIGGYRDHGHALAVGMDPKAIMAELYGKATGCSKGKGGSMHMYSAEKHMLGGNGIVGSQIPVGTGVAWKIKYMEENGVVLCYFGDGAIHQGAFHESLNLAKIHDLPIIYIVENNQYGMGTDFKRVSAVHDLAQMGYAYDIPGKQLNGMQVMEVYDEFVNAVKSIREKPHPLFYEIKTYRYRGHSMSDPAKYRTPEELEEYKQQDPISILLKQMQEEKLITEKEYKKMDNDIKAICDEAVDFAEKSPEPELSALYEDVFAEA